MTKKLTWLRRLLFKRCPQCAEGSLVSRNSIRATLLVDSKRVPDSWTYYECSSCGARLKLPLGRDFELVQAEEWNKTCDPIPVPATDPSRNE